MILELVESFKTVLVYGEAASGKTNLVLSLAAELATARDLYICYISSESEADVQRALSLIPTRKLSILKVYDLDDVIHALLTRAKGCQVLVIDSLTAPYRYELTNSLEKALVKLGLTLALLAEYALQLGTIVLATSQVHEKLDIKDIEPLAFERLYSYFNLVVRVKKVERDKHKACLEKPSLCHGMCIDFIVTKEGIRCIPS